MKQIYFFIFVLLTLAGLSTEAAAQSSSLWQRRDPNVVNQFADVKARRPGDLLVIRINEKSNVQNKDQRLLQKQNESSSDASTTFNVAGDLGDGTGGLDFEQDSSASRNFNGNTQYKSERAFVDQFTVTVIDVNPNGNLLVSGTRHVALEGDQRTLILTGIVRASDVMPDNSISSLKVADLDIRYDTTGKEGAEEKFINQGWLGRKLNRIWPY